MYILIQTDEKVKLKQKKFPRFSKKIDNARKIVYNRRVGGEEMSKIAIIGGGAAGLMLAANLNISSKDHEIVLFERGERVGRKLSATGNGQGNITNLHVTEGGYFSFNSADTERANCIVRTYDDTDLKAFFARLGIILTADDRGRVYPASRQASSLTDGLRYYLQHKGIKTNVGCLVTAIEKKGGGFSLRYKTEDTPNNRYDKADFVIICAGGNAAKNFGTDGSGYALAKSFGHTVTPIYPSLVQLKTDTTNIKGLKGIRINNAKLTAKTPQGKASVQGDIIFTEYGVSGDAVFRLTPFIVGKNLEGTSLAIDFLPDLDEESIREHIVCKTSKYDIGASEGLFGIVNNQLGRMIMRLANNDCGKAAALVKAFPLRVTGSLGFDYAQVTKGGIPLSETDENLQSRLADGLYFAGEILDVDGECGGYNLQWAYSSARVVASAVCNAINRK